MLFTPQVVKFDEGLTVVADGGQVSILDVERLVGSGSGPDS
jgi:hypothetical protein